MTRKRNCKQRIGQKWKLWTSGPGYRYILFFAQKLNKQLKVIQFNTDVIWHWILICKRTQNFLTNVCVLIWQKPKVTIICLEFINIHKTWITLLPLETSFNRQLLTLTSFIHKITILHSQLLECGIKCVYTVKT